MCAALVCSSAGDSPGFFFYLFVFVLFCFCFFVNDSDKKEEEAAPDWDDPEFVKEQEYLFAVFVYENGFYLLLLLLLMKKKKKESDNMFI